VDGAGIIEGSSVNDCTAASSVSTASGGSDRNVRIGCVLTGAGSGGGSFVVAAGISRAAGETPNATGCAAIGEGGGEFCA
jgi:hypothetical protein